MGFCSNSMFLMNNGTVKAVGDNAQGQLGIGNTTTPITAIGNMSITGRVKQIACGGNHTMFLMSDGSVKGCGYNAYGNLGLGNVISPVSTVSDVPNLTGVKQIACGAIYTIFLMENGTVKSVGLNTNGELGLGYATASPYYETTISNIPNLTGVKQIACGEYHTIFLMNDGTVKGVGRNSSGQLGLGVTTSPITTISDIPSISGVKQVVCGKSHTIFLMDDGSVKSVGSNSYGELGLGHNTSPISTISDIPDLTGVTQVECGEYHTIFLMYDGKVMSTGHNRYGELGLGYATASPYYRSTVSENPSFSGVKQVSCGRYHTIFLMDDGTVKSVGFNGSGQLGLGNTTSPVTAISDIPITETVISLFSFILETLILLKENNQYYSIWEEYYDTVNKVYIPISSPYFYGPSFNFDNLFTETTIEDETFIPFDKFSSPSIVSGSPFVTLQMNAIKSNSQLVVASGDISLENVFDIDSFTLTTNIVGDGDIKLAVSIDSGNTWLTFNDVASEFSLLENVTIPLKAFEEMSEQEITQWNDATTSIANNGIDFTNFNTLNFNSFKNDFGATTIRFAYVLTRYTTEDVTEVDELEWQFDVFGHFRKMKDSEYDVEVYSDAIEVKSLIDNEIMKINYIK